ncbi:hypothetical protein H5410_025887 [Solanum commersonii]|uniref:Uncharacterized protein n=1 Tax=Solanum commersonii TaxID=4109 RepID=A0A9J5YUG7_SOLCO|nr:hypothetical protein H5410_025887 [Solanum commersonii]
MFDFLEEEKKKMDKKEEEGRKEEYVSHVEMLGDLGFQHLMQTGLFHVQT